MQIAFDAFCAHVGVFCTSNYWGNGLLLAHGSAWWSAPPPPDMPRWEPPMQKHFRHSNRMLSVLDEHGISSATVLRRAHLSQDLLNEPRFLLTTEEMFALCRAIGEVSGDPAIGLSLGTVTRTQNFNPTGIVALRLRRLVRPWHRLGDTSS